MGLVMISSNSGKISPVALIVFSMSPFSTTAVVMLDFFRDDANEVRSSHIAAARMAMIIIMTEKVFFFLFDFTSSSITVSIKIICSIVFKTGAKHKSLRISDLLQFGFKKMFDTGQIVSEWNRRRR